VITIAAGLCAVCSLLFIALSIGLEQFLDGFDGSTETRQPPAIPVTQHIQRISLVELCVSAVLLVFSKESVIYLSGWLHAAHSCMAVG